VTVVCTKINLGWKGLNKNLLCIDVNICIRVCVVGKLVSVRTWFTVGKFGEFELLTGSDL